MKKLKSDVVLVLVGAILAVLAVINLGMSSSMMPVLSERINQAEEAAKPVSLKVTTITTNCEDCSSLESVVQALTGTGEAIVEEQTSVNAQDAQELILTYNLKQLPAIIVEGDVSNKQAVEDILSQVGEQHDSSWVVNALQAPYFDVAKDRVYGRLKLTYLLKEDCDQCQDITTFAQQLAAVGVSLSEEKTVAFTSSEGSRLINKYAIDAVPTLLFEGDVDAYPVIGQAWDTIGSVEDDGTYVLRTISPPYYSLNEGRVVGNLMLTAIVDRTCAECYDPLEFHRPILGSMGITPAEEATVDVSEAVALISKYGITQVPTIVLTGDIKAYNTTLGAVWQQVGKVVDDAYVFTKVELAQKPYKDLKTGEIITSVPETV